MHLTQLGGKMKVSKKKLVKIIREVLKIEFKPGTSEDEKKSMLSGLIKMLDVGEEEV